MEFGQDHHLEAFQVSSFKTIVGESYMEKTHRPS